MLRRLDGRPWRPIRAERPILPASCAVILAGGERQQFGAWPNVRLRVTLGQGSQNPTCRFCGATLVFRGQTSCQSCGRNLAVSDSASEAASPPQAVQPPPLVSAPLAASAPLAVSTPLAAATTLAAGSRADSSLLAAATPLAAPESLAAGPAAAPEAVSPVRFFESSRMPPPTPLPASPRLSDAMAPTATAVPSGRTITPADAAASTAGDAPASSVAPLIGQTYQAGRPLPGQPVQGQPPAGLFSPPPIGGARAQPLQSVTPRRSAGVVRDRYVPPGAPRSTGTARRSASPGTGRPTPPLPGPTPPPPSPSPEQRWANQGYGQSGRGRNHARTTGGSSCLSTLAVWTGIVMIALAVFALVGGAVKVNRYVPDPGYGNVDITPYYNGDQVGAATTAPFPATNPLVSVGTLKTPRVNHTATLLSNGRVVIASGETGSTSVVTAISSVEIYDPTSRSFDNEGTMIMPRSNQTATLLANGTILFAGGQDELGNALSSAEIYDPATSTSVLTGPMTTPRISASAVALDDGRVLIAGGSNGSDPLGSVDIFDPSSGTFSSMGSVSKVSGALTATRMLDGRILLAGGDASSGSSYIADVFDPLAGGVVSSAPMAISHGNATSCLLSDGTVMVVGGLDDSKQVNSTAEIYNPTNDSFESPIQLLDGRAFNSTTVLPNGSVLLAGGVDSYGNAIASVERFSPGKGISEPIGTMVPPRYGHTATLLADGSVLIVGGRQTSDWVLSEADLYYPDGPPATGPSTSPDSSYSPVPVPIDTAPPG